VTGVEVLAPVRLETRFVAPERREDGGAGWLLRVRIYPDEFSIRRTVAPPSSAELDRLAEAVSALSADPALDEAAAFASVGSAVGATRALGLWRSWVVPDGAGGLTVDRSGEADHVPFQAHGPAGLPERLELWLIHADGTRELGATLVLDLAGIGADLDLAVFDDEARLADGRLPETWWLSYPRAVSVGLAADIELGPVPPVLDALMVIGTGTSDAAYLVDEHSAGGRLAVLAPGTPTNTVAGEPTTDLGQNPESLYPLLHADAAGQPSTSVVLRGLTGRVGPGALPMPGGDLDYFGPGSLAVQGLWPVLWGRSLRDVVGAGDTEVDVADWAAKNLPVEGPRPAFRVGEQPYGLLPTSAFADWTGEPGDERAAVEQRILRWALPWRAGAAGSARAADRRVTGADPGGLLDALGAHAPSRHWRVRPVADRNLIQAQRALDGLPGMPATDWDRLTAAAWRDWPYPQAPIGAAARGGPVPGPPRDDQDDAELLAALCRMEPDELYFGRIDGLGLVGHLIREAMIDARAIVGDAVVRLGGGPVQLGRPQPLDDEQAFAQHVTRGTDGAVAALDASPDPDARRLGRRFHDVQEALIVLADLWKGARGPLFRAVLAALDTATIRVDPWLTGIADRRVQRMAAQGAPFRLGAYGWVDAPAPFAAGAAALAPGPTAAGLLHAPSPAQALTAALLRDAAVRYPSDDRWQLTIDSARVRASIALAERVRLGVHPYEALGLEVEKVAGDWDSVRILRARYPLAPDQHLRRVCDGEQVLRAARENTLVDGLALDLPARLAPLDQVLDTYADLLLADGLHALVTGRADLANAAMEAAAGLGAPPDLRAIRTPRAAGTVRVGAWAVLPPGVAQAVPADPDADPGEVADPAFVALLAAEPGAAGEPAETETLFAGLLGGGPDEPPVPALTGGDYEGLPASANDDLRGAVLADLDARLVRLRGLAQARYDDLATPPGGDPDPVTTRDALRWRVDLTGVPASDPEAAGPSAADRRAAHVAALAGRLADAAALPPTDGTAVSDEAVNARRRAIRTLAGRPAWPVLPVVDAALLPVLHPAPDCDSAWLELVAAVRPRLAALEAHQFDRTSAPWAAAIATGGGSLDPWHAGGPVLVTYGPEPPAAPGAALAIAALDAWTDSIPSRRHVSTAAFGFNSPKSRAPQAILLAVPPDPSRPLDTAGLLDVVLETRELVHARAAQPGDAGGLPYATPTPLVHAASKSLGFRNGWPA
jgi:hypothetical protein